MQTNGFTEFSLTAPCSLEENVKQARNINAFCQKSSPSKKAIPVPLIMSIRKGVGRLR